MTTHMIKALLQADIDPDLIDPIVDHLPLSLIPVERNDAFAPDYRIDGRYTHNLGCGWSRVSPTFAIVYVDIIIQHPSGLHITGVAWQFLDRKGEWFAQLQGVNSVKLDA